MLTICNKDTQIFPLQQLVKHTKIEKKNSHILRVCYINCPWPYLKWNSAHRTTTNHLVCAISCTIVFAGTHFKLHCTVSMVYICASVQAYVHICKFFTSLWQEVQNCKLCLLLFMSLQIALATAAYIHYPNHSHCHLKIFFDILYS